MKMYILKQIMIKNFKIFNKHTEFPIYPITLLTGTNNSGKTTLIESLLLLGDASLSSKLNRLNFGGEHLELGSFDTCLSHDSKDSNIDFKLIFEKMHLFPNNIKLLPNKVLLTLRYKSQFEDGKLVLLNIWGIDDTRKEVVPIIIATIPTNLDEDNQTVLVNVKHFLSTISNTIKSFSNILPQKQSIPIGKMHGIKSNLSLSIDYGNPKVDDIQFPKRFHSLNTNIIDKDSLKKLFEQITEVDFKNVYITLNEYLLNHLSMFILTKEWFRRYFPGEEGMLNKQEISNLIWMFSDPFIFIEDIKIENIDFSKEIHDISKFSEEIDRLEFTDLKRSKHIISDISDVFIKDILKDVFLDFYTNFLGNYIYSNYNDIIESIRIEHLDIFKSSKSRLYFDSDKQTALGKNLLQLSHIELTDNNKKFISEWLNKFNIGDDLLFERISGTATKVVVLKGNSKIELADLGYGSSQFVSILISVVITSLNNNNGKELLFAIEEPETNLHPKLQSLLADFFVEATKKYSINFIIETHSEYLIRKLQYLTAKKKINPKDSIIYYFHHPENIPKGEEQVKEIKINEDGSLTDDFGPGFFDEATNIKFDLLKIKNTQNN